MTAPGRPKFASSAPAGSVSYSTSTHAAGLTTFSLNVGPIPASAAPKPSKEVENAVYAYVRAVRALGRTEVIVSDISKALDIAEPTVIQALAALRSKGIKFA
jgi:hypothetical protein